MCQFAVVHPTVMSISATTPTAQMDLVDCDWFLQPMRLAALIEPLSVVPAILVEVCDDGCSAGGQFGGKAIRVRLIYDFACSLLHSVLVFRAALQTGDENFPDPAGD